MSKSTFDLNEINEIIGSHEAYWASKQGTMNNLTNMMKQQLFRSQTNQIGLRFNDQIIIEPAVAHSVIEGFMSNLYPKAPAIICGGDLKGKGNPEIVQAVVNRFLFDQSDIIERTMSGALIYPFSFWKLAILPDEQVDSVIDQVDMRPIHPWDIVVDFDADKFENSRYIGHRYWLPIKEASKRWSVRFTGAMKKNYLTNPSTQSQAGVPRAATGTLGYIEVYELYDLINDELIFFSRNADRSDKVIECVSPIPFRKFNGRPLVPLVPMYFYKAVDVPLQGESTLYRLYDSIIEKINLRTIWANGIRKESRQAFSVRGTLDDEAKAIYSENRDGAIIEIDVPNGIPITQAILPVPNTTLSPDFSIYESLVEKDLTTGSMLGQFTQGVATNATATEVAAITQYTSSELGKLARIRDRAIESMAEVYSGLIAFLLMTSDDDKETITVDNQAITIVADDFIGKFRFSAADQASTPIGAAMQRQNAVALLGPLEALGVSKDKLLDYMVKSFDLPSDFKAEVPVAAPTVAPNEVVPGGPQNVNEAVPVGGGQVASAIRNTLP